MSGSGGRIFLIATEESGDRLGAALMARLKSRIGDNVELIGVGGRAMAGEGLNSLFDVKELAIVGLSGVLRQLPKILRLIRFAADSVIAAGPDVLVIIDSPDFTHRVARRVRALNPGIPIVNYAPPSVWAWRRHRASAMRAYIDEVMALLPFEPEHYRALHGPPCAYVGHPLLEQLSSMRPGEGDEARAAAQAPVLVVMPGSRSGEIAQHLELFGAAIGGLRAAGHDFTLILPTMPHLEARLREGVASWPVAPGIVVDEVEKRAWFRIAHAALVKSGTGTLELALAGIPMVTAYRLGAVEAFFLRPFLRHFLATASVILPNLVLGETAIPQFIQEQCTAQNLTQGLIGIWGDSPARQSQMAALARLDGLMATDGKAPSEKAAGIVVASMRKRLQLPAG
ncbi:MAG: lipid-A-disaccharide synthase [Alphaproteobacteria bacterium]|nr:lipid-A-disaccharide synthase [Alphaproteobacteria bacterium]